MLQVLYDQVLFSNKNTIILLLGNFSRLPFVILRNDTLYSGLQDNCTRGRLHVKRASICNYVLQQMSCCVTYVFSVKRVC